jgi:hypothetical protein
VNTACSTTTARRACRIARRRAYAASLASVMVLGYALPVSSAVAESPPVVSGELGVNGAVSVQDPEGQAAELLQRLTLTQLATLLHTTPAELAHQIELLPGNGAVSPLLDELLANPTATLESVIGNLTAKGSNPAAVEQLMSTSLASVAGNSDQLRGVLDTVLGDLGVNGALPAVAKQLGLATSTLQELHFAPSSPERLANSLNTTADHLSTLMAAAGAITKSLPPSAPLVVAPVNGSNAFGRTEVAGAPDGDGGVTLITLNSTAPGQPGGAGVAGARRATPASNAFSIVSITVTQSGVIVERVILPGPGRLEVNATARRKVATKALASRRNTTVKTATVASLSANVAGGTHTIRLRPKSLASVAKRTLVTVRTTYTPTGGSPATKQNPVILKRVAQKGGRRTH